MKKLEMDKIGEYILNTTIILGLVNTAFIVIAVYNLIRGL